MDFRGTSEQYFEDTSQFTGVLAHKGSTIILPYNKANNTFRLPANQMLGEGTYRLTVSAIMCTPHNTPCDNCTIYHDFEVVYVNDPNLSVSIQSDPNPAILTCLPGSAVTLLGTPPLHSGFRGQWARLANMQFDTIPGATDPAYTSSDAGTYLYTLYGPAGCEASNIASIGMPLSPLIDVDVPEQPLNACAQAIAGVAVEAGGAPGNLTLQWTATNGGILLGGETTTMPVAAAAGTYTLLAARADNGCTATATVQLVPGIVPTVIAQIAPVSGVDILDCRTPNISLRATASLSVGTSAYTYTWSTGATGNEITVDAAGTYSVTATSTGNGCLGTTDILIFQDLSAPILQIISPRDTVCAGESIALTAMALEPVTYHWQDNSTTGTLTVSPPQNGPNAYAVTVTAADNGCTSTAVKWIERVDIPQITCTADALTVPNGSQATIECPIVGSELIWSAVAINVRNTPPSGSGPVQDKTFELANTQAPGTVQYAFFAKNAGCTSDRAEVLVTVLPANPDDIFIPELITPNGDGQNDTWAIVYRETITNPEAYRLSLFNRYGALVWEANIATPFRADNYPDGAYFYVVNKPDGGQIRGAVTILRRK